MKIAPAVLAIGFSLLISPQQVHAFGRAQHLGSIQAESAVPQKAIALLTDDLNWLQSLGPVEPSSEFLEVLEVPDASSQTLSLWLESRVHYLLAQDFKPRIFWNIRPYFFKKFGYPDNGLPELEFPKDAGSTPTLAPDNGQEREAMVVMANLGSGLYLAGKMSKVLLSIQFRGVGRLPITSPRTGIIQIGDGLFHDGFFKDELPQDSVVRKAFRMQTFFHEARHSDGNGKSIGFLHALCPPGHGYAGVNACDRNSNGPYTVGALMIEQLAKACPDCSTVEKETLRILTLDSRSRIIPQKDGAPALKWDAAPEEGHYLK